MSTRHCSSSDSHSQDEVIAFLSDGASYGLPGAGNHGLPAQPRVSTAQAVRIFKTYGAAMPSGHDG